MRHVVVALVVLAVATIALAACGEGSRGNGDQAGDSRSGDVGRGDKIPVSRGYEDNAPPLAHVHGIGENPQDGAIYIATHFGLWRMQQGSDPQRVGDYLHDFMGFSVVGPDHFIASGHPNGAESLPPHLGLIESTDAGQTWHSRSLLGEADFHALRTVKGATFGWSSTDGNLMASDDLQEWDVRSEGVAIVDFAVEPTTQKTVVISTPLSQTKLELRRSGDQGRSFSAVQGGPQIARFAWSQPDELWGFGVDGTVWSSSDSGRTWNRAGNIGAAPEAAADTGDALLAAAAGKIQQSTDAGRTWDVLHKYEE